MPRPKIRRPLDRPLVLVDIETTTLSPYEGGSICEATVLVAPNRLVPSGTVYTNRIHVPTLVATPEACAAGRYDLARWRQHEDADELVDRNWLITLLGAHVLADGGQFVSWNKGFELIWIQHQVAMDLGDLVKEFMGLGYHSLDLPDMTYDWQIYDESQFPTPPSMRSVAEYFGITLDDAISFIRSNFTVKSRAAGQDGWKSFEDVALEYLVARRVMTTPV